MLSAFLGCVLTIVSWVMIVAMWSILAKTESCNNPKNIVWWAKPITRRLWNKLIGWLFTVFFVVFVLAFFALIGYGAVIIPFKLIFWSMR